MFACFFGLMFFFIPVSAAESPASSSPSSSNITAEKIICEFQAVDQNGIPCAARLFIADGRGKTLSPETHPADSADSSDLANLKTPFYLLRGGNVPLRIHLSPDNYQIIFDGGPRRERARLRINVAASSTSSSAQSQKFSVALAPWHWKENSGWLMLNPLLSFAAPDGNQIGNRDFAKKINALSARLLALIRSSGLRAVGMTDLAKWRNAGAQPLINEMAKRDANALNLLSLERGDGWAIIDREIPPVNSPTDRDGNLSAEIKLAAATDRGGLTIFTTGGDVAKKLFYLATSDLYQAFDITRGGDDFAFWQFWLRQGRHLPAVTGGGAIPNLSMYARIERQAPNNADILTAIRDGRTVISNAPFVRFWVVENNTEDAGQAADLGNAAGIGDTIPASNTPREIIVEAFASSDPNDTIKQIDFLYNGKVVESVKPIAGEKSLQTRWHNLALRSDGWLQARYISTAPYLWAITNPLYVGERQSPIGIVTNLRLTVKTPTSDAAVGTIIAENFGVKLWERTVKNRELIEVRLPSTATLTVKFGGFVERKISIAELSGAMAFCRQVAASPAKLQAKWISELREILREVEAEILIGQARNN